MAQSSLLTIRKVAERLAIAPSTAYALVQSGKIASHRIGLGRGAIRVDERDLEAYLEFCRSSPRAAPRPKEPPSTLKHLRI
jgi:excisionase family DNA binding protein